MGDSNTIRQRNGTLSEANLVHTSSRSIPPVTYVLSEPQQSQQNTQPRESLSDIEEEVTERDGFITRIFKLRGFVSFIFLLVFGTAILISPTVNIVRTDPNAWIDFQQNTTALTSQTPNQIVVVWSVFLSVSWIIFLGTWFTLLSLPVFTIEVIERFYGTCSEQTRQTLAYIPELQVWLSLMIWAIGSVLAFRIIFLQLVQVNPWENIFSFFLCGMIFTIVLFFQRLFVQKIAFDFHKVAYEERMSQSRKAIDIIEHLRGALVGNTNLFGDLFESEKNDMKIPDPVSGEDEHVGKDDMPQDQEPPPRQRKSVFSWFSKNQQQPIPQDRNSIEIKVEEGDSLTRTLSQKSKVPTGSRTAKRKTLSKEAKGNSFLTWDQFKSALKIGGLGAKKSKGMDLLSDRHATFLSEKLFGVLRSPDTNEISVGSFFAYFDQEEQAKSAFALFDKDGNGSINQMELKWAILRIYRERRNLMKSLRDLSSALGTLNDLLYGFSIILSLLLSLPVFGIPITTIVPFSTILVGLSFMFGGTAKVTFDSIIFIFAVHPYDVGDRVFIDGNNYVVEEFNILTTTFTIDGQKIYIPNAVLNGKTIINVRRSTDMSDYITIKVDFNTPESKLKELQAKMIEFTTAQSRNFRPTCSMDFMDMSSSGMITLRFSVDFKGNWQDGARRWGRRTAFLFELKRQLENHGICFEMPVQPVRMIERE
ncbi:hypothetical protein HK103_005290 [Boothiomyces macroporosus]|uniref:EF-hand domain-containing protein n=1 Tax=Boothiomyces macroporosus TaxID=261099 RepID=A0AAD5UFA5_9FUNG|nr:hypothetical protein HK103_000327 [Boothiomyces macroporosus]KAJ3256547.1 hypothetical protein HK103_005290 [Boothiomyces macroporosus]